MRKDKIRQKRLIKICIGEHLCVILRCTNKGKRAIRSHHIKAEIGKLINYKRNTETSCRFDGGPRPQG